jgi:hypothetical protein
MGEARSVARLPPNPTATQADGGQMVPGRRGLAVVVMVVTLAAVVPASVDAAVVGSITVNAQIGGCFVGKGPANSSGTVVWKTAAGRLKASFNTTSDGDGTFYAPKVVCAQLRLAVGDTLKMTFPYVARTFTVPMLTVNFNRSSNVISGSAPPSSSLALNVVRPWLARSEGTEIDCDTTVHVGGTGTWSLDATTLSTGGNCPSDYDPIGGDQATVFWTSPKGDTVFRYGYAHFVLATIGDSSITGAVGAGQSVKVEERNPSGGFRGSLDRRGDGSGQFHGTLKNASSTLIKVRIGDTVDGNWAGSVAFKVPTLAITWDTGANSVRGRCMPNARYGFVYHHGGESYGGNGVTDGAGMTSSIVPGITLTSGDSASLICARSSGDLVERFSVLP